MAVSLARMAVADRPWPVRRCDTGRRRRSWLRVIGGFCQAPSDQGAQRPSHRHPERPGRLRRQRPLPTAASLGFGWRSRPKLLHALRVRQREPHQVHQRLTAEAPGVQLRSSKCVTGSGRTASAEWNLRGPCNRIWGSGTYTRRSALVHGPHSDFRTSGKTADQDWPLMPRPCHRAQHHRRCRHVDAGWYPPRDALRL
jgi:hypothetical protein